MVEDFDVLGTELDAERGLVLGFELLFGEAEEQAGLAHVAVADDDEFEQVVVVVVHGVGEIINAYDRR